MIKDETEMRQLSEGEVIAALDRVAGEGKGGYLRQLIGGSQFDRADFEPLVPAFNAYVDWLAGRFFGGSRLRFLLFLDIVAGKGAEWPHYATYLQAIQYRRDDAMRDFDAYLAKLGKSAADKVDVLAALKAATGKDHSGFFEFWESWGITLDPAVAVQGKEAAPVQSEAGFPKMEPPKPQSQRPASPSQKPAAAEPERAIPEWVVPAMVTATIVVCGGVVEHMRAGREHQGKKPPG